MEKMWSPWRSQYIEHIGEERKGCVFCAAPKENEDEKSLILYRGDFTYIIMNKYPYNNGHLMVVPYEHVSDPSQIDEKTSTEMWKLLMFSQEALKKSIYPHGFNLGMNIGESGGAGIKDHLHMHIVPRWNGDTNFSVTTADFKVLSEALEETRKKIIKFL